MSVCIDLPKELEAQLRSQIADLDQAAKEALLIELFRQDKVTHHELGQALGIGRFAVDELLVRHGVTEDLPTAAEIELQAVELGARLGK